MQSGQKIVIKPSTEASKQLSLFFNYGKFIAGNHTCYSFDEFVVTATPSHVKLPPLAPDDYLYLQQGYLYKYTASIDRSIGLCPANRRYFDGFCYAWRNWLNSNVKLFPIDRYRRDNGKPKFFIPRPGSRWRNESDSTGWPIPGSDGFEEFEYTPERARFNEATGLFEASSPTARGNGARS